MKLEMRNKHKAAGITTQSTITLDNAAGGKAVCTETDYVSVYVFGDESDSFDGRRVHVDIDGFSLEITGKALISLIEKAQSEVDDAETASVV
jgi:hypothetical protein